jgi:guanine deaminase
MQLAIKEAYSGIKKGHGGPFGAVIVKDGKVIAKAHNQVVFQHDPTCHGEMLAIRRASKKLQTFDLSGCIIYTTGEPCPMCLGAILWANISFVYYGCNVDDTQIIGFRDKKFYEFKKDSFMKELNRQEVLKLYKEYRDTQDKTSY